MSQLRGRGLSLFRFCSLFCVASFCHWQVHVCWRFWRFEDYAILLQVSLVDRVGIMGMRACMCMLSCSVCACCSMSLFVVVDHFLFCCQHCPASIVLWQVLACWMCMQVVIAVCVNSVRVQNLCTFFVSMFCMCTVFLCVYVC